MKITVSNRLILEHVPPQIDREVSARMTFKNPQWIENDRMGRWQGETPEYLTLYERVPNGVILLPRGYTRQLIDLCKQHDIAYHVEDRRKSLPRVLFEFRSQLRRFQEKALTDIIARDFGTLSAPTGAGKTVIGLAAIAARRQPALIVIHTRELLHQWIDRIETFLQIPRAEIGQIGNGKKTIGDRITVALVQSLYKCAQDVAPRIGHLIVDECHRCPSRTFVEAVTAFDSRYMLGLSATPWRRDKLSRLIYWHLGDMVHEVDRQSLQDAGHILKADVVWRETAFTTTLDPSEEYSRVLSELTQDPARNQLIASDIAHAAGNGGGTCLCLSDRKAHCETISGLLRSHGIEAPVLTGDTSKSERESIVERLNRGQIKVVCATGQLLGEGFDCSILQTLFLATPIKFNGRIIQYIGRILRPAPGKDRATIFDYLDENVGVLAASAKSRQRLYDNL